MLSVFLVISLLAHGGGLQLLLQSSENHLLGFPGDQLDPQWISFSFFDYDAFAAMQKYHFMKA